MGTRRSGRAGDRVIVCFVGYSGAGKTTLITRLIPLLRQMGIVVACVKHHHGADGIARSGAAVVEGAFKGDGGALKDTDQYMAAGARAAMLIGASRVSIQTSRTRHASLRTLVEHHLSGARLVLAEGFSGEPCPRVAVVSRRSPRLRPGRGPLIAAVGWNGRDLGVPVFDHQDVAGLARFLARLLTRHSPPPRPRPRRGGSMSRRGAAFARTRMGGLYNGNRNRNRE